jgi:hypothetical protein
MIGSQPVPVGKDRKWLHCYITQLLRNSLKDMSKVRLPLRTENLKPLNHPSVQDLEQQLLHQLSLGDGDILKSF